MNVRDLIKMLKTVPNQEAPVYLFQYYDYGIGGPDVNCTSMVYDDKSVQLTDEDIS